MIIYLLIKLVLSKHILKIKWIGKTWIADLIECQPDLSQGQV